MDRQETDQDISERALSFLEKIPPEENIIISEWEEVRNYFRISILFPGAYTTQK